MGLSFARTAKVLSYLGIDVTAGAICQFCAWAASTELVPFTKWRSSAKPRRARTPRSHRGLLVKRDGRRLG